MNAQPAMITVYMQVIARDPNSVIAATTTDSVEHAAQAVANLRAQGFRAWAWINQLPQTLKDLV